MYELVCLWPCTVSFIILQRLNLRVKGYGQSAALVKLKHSWGQLTSDLNVLLRIINGKLLTSSTNMDGHHGG